MHRKEKVLLTFIIFLAALIQSTFLDYLRIEGIKPDILLCLVIFIGLYAEKSFSLKAGLFAGVLKDVLSGGVLGLNILIFGLVAFFLGSYSSKVYRKNTILQVVICFVITFLISNFSYFVYSFSYSLAEYIKSLKIIILPITLYTCLAFYLISLFLSRTLKIT